MYRHRDFNNNNISYTNPLTYSTCTLLYTDRTSLSIKSWGITSYTSQIHPFKTSLYVVLSPNKWILGLYLYKILFNIH